MTPHEPQDSAPARPWRLCPWWGHPAVACSGARTTRPPRRRGNPGAGDSSGRRAAAPVRRKPLLHPAKKYFGVALDGAPSSMKPVDAFAKTVGKKPPTCRVYSSWGDGFNAAGAKNVFDDEGCRTSPGSRSRPASARSRTARGHVHQGFARASVRRPCPSRSASRTR